MFQLHPEALYLLGAVYLTGDCVKKDIASALWCFHRASEKVVYQLIKFKELIFLKTLICVLNIFLLFMDKMSIRTFLRVVSRMSSAYIVCHYFMLL